MQAAKDSLPKRVRSIVDEDERMDLCAKVEVEVADRLATVKSLQKRVKSLKKGRSPGLDGFTAEHLVSLTQAGRGQSTLKKSILEQYALSLRKIVAAKLTVHQNEALNAIKLAGIPKDLNECRPIMMFSIHTKLAFSLFTSSNLKKRLDKDLFTSQDGLTMGYIDDLHWAAPFEKMVQAIAFVQNNGSKFGYKLNLKKSVYLMSPSPNVTTFDQIGYRLIPCVLSTGRRRRSLAVNVSRP